jgi:membrane-bound ClpP family serine protease
MGGNEGNNGYTSTRIMLLALVAAYIIYLGVNILLGVYRGEGGIPVPVAILFGVLFIAAGIGYLYYLFKQYMALKAAENENQTVTGSAEEIGEDAEDGGDAEVNDEEASSSAEESVEDSTEESTEASTDEDRETAAKK